MYRAIVIWDGQFKVVDVAASESEPLLGMSLLYGFKLQVDADIPACYRFGFEIYPTSYHQMRQLDFAGDMPSQLGNSLKITLKGTAINPQNCFK
jgi:hypothetical protein